ncbi:LuxR family transcriptional regulator [Streptomyces sp. NPDC058953]|uniref:helix-turn-helix transcriptional regulator n=1 Tax=unclassified Streptomyces TaxID=2593676 RepID=UPI00368AB5F4
MPRPKSGDVSTDGFNGSHSDRIGPRDHGPVHRGDPWDGADQMERALLDARALIDSTMSLHRNHPARRPLVVRADEAGAGPTIERLLERAKQTVSASVPGGDEEALEVFAALTGHRRQTAPAPRAEAATAADRVGPPAAGQVTVRLLCGPGALRGGVPSAAQLRQARCEIRVTTDGPGETLIVDGCLALLKAGPELPESIAIIKDPASVHALDMLFASLWATARPLEEHLRLSLCSLTAQRVLERLREGQTDDVAARALNISLRTYRRQVAGVMSALGVSSRFQAGVRAVELGLLPRQSSSPSRQVHQVFAEAQ